MEEKEIQGFSWSTFFCVTAISFVVFSAALNFLDAPHSGLFLRIGLGCAALGILAILNTWLGAKMSAEKNPSPSQQQQELF
jgi:hypothetical protein